MTRRARNLPIIILTAVAGFAAPSDSLTLTDKAVRITPADGGYYNRPAYSPDGLWIAFEGMEGGNEDVYVIRLDGTGRRRLTTHPAPDGNPIWSRDGHRIFFNRFDPAAKEYTLRVVNADGSGESLLTPGRSSGFRPAPSPDETRFAFDDLVRGDSGSSHQIFVMSSDGTNVTQLTHTPPYEAAPSWAPDGRRLVFYSQRDDPGAPLDRGQHALYVMNSDGSAQRRLTDGVDAYYPRWSPRGSLVAYVSEQNGRSSISVLDVAAPKPIRLTDGPGQVNVPTWSPDGHTVAFASNRDGTWAIYAVELPR